MNLQQRAIAEICEHCDLRERIALMPPSAQVRGVFFRSIDTVLAPIGKLQRFREIFPERLSALRWHPTQEFLSRMAVAGGMLLGPERVHEGMHELARRNAVDFSESILGRSLLLLLSRDPKKLLQQAMVGRRQGGKPARWTLTFPEERTAMVTMVEEYIYIESYHVGGAQGAFDAIGMPVKIEVIMEDRFNGKHIIRW